MNIMYIIFLLFLFIKNENKKYSKNMTNIYYIEEIPNIYTNNNTENIIIKNENITTTYKKKYSRKGFDNRNITEENNLQKIIGYNKIMNMLNFLLENKSDYEKISFIQKNDIRFGIV
jgi:hypothetical protein